MTADIFPLQLLLLTVSGWVNTHQQQAIEYLIEENRVLKEQLKGRRLRLAYFSVGHWSRCFSYIREWVERKVRRHLERARQRRGFGWKRWSRRWIYEELGLFRDYRITYLRPNDATGDGAGNTLISPQGIAVDGLGNVYVTGINSANAFQITPGGVITEIIDSTGDGAGNALTVPIGIAANGSGNVYVTGGISDNAFQIDLCPSLASSEVVRIGVPPNPGSLSPGAGGPPSIGTVWTPTVTGVASVLDVVVTDPLGAMLNVPLAVGTLLCDITPPTLFFFGGPGTPIPIPIPNDCSLVGQAVCAQGAGLTFAPLTLSLTNALDLVIGTF